MIAVALLLAALALLPLWRAERAARGGLAIRVGLSAFALGAVVAPAGNATAPAAPPRARPLEVPAGGHAG